MNLGDTVQPTAEPEKVRHRARGSRAPSCRVCRRRRRRAEDNVTLEEAQRLPRAQSRLQALSWSGDTRRTCLLPGSGGWALLQGAPLPDTHHLIVSVRVTGAVGPWRDETRRDSGPGAVTTSRG